MTNPRQYSRIFIDDADAGKLAEPLEAMQDAIQQATEDLDSSPALSGVLVQDKELASGSNTIRHTLGRAPRIVLPGAPSVQADVWVTASDTSALTVSASVACTVSFWVM
ncbi:MAG: hypothetical protein KAI66_11625 [Lentisphaeria bacterium]|nr:hypothetical protein [Lentisphaeria bacterium]